MNKVFLYLYPIEEFTRIFILEDDKLYDEWDIQRPLPILNECIEKRYRTNGYKVVFAMYPDKEIFGLDKKDEDKIIYTDITFKQASGYDEESREKPKEEIMYPDEQFLISQLGNVDKLVVGGYHYSDCVRRLSEEAIECGIDTIVDLDLTDLFFGLYKQEDYFKIEEYDKERYKNYRIEFVKFLDNNYENNSEYEEKFLKNYSSPAYGFNNKGRTR